MANDFSGDANCKALWSFENGALITDSKGTNTLSDYNTVASDTTNFKEKSGSALFAEANQEMFYVTDANLDAGFPLKDGDSTKKISICAWIRPGDSGDASRGIFEKGSTGKASLRIYLDANDKLVVGCGYNSGADYEDFTHGTAITCDGATWYHIGIVIDGVAKTIFVKIQTAALAKVGSNIDTSITNELNVEDAYLYIGRYLGTAGYYTGNQDEFVVFDDLLSEAEIDQIAAGTFGAAAGVEVSADSASLEITRYAANINAETNVRAAAEALEIAGFAADVNLNVSVSASSEALEITNYAAAIKADTNVAASAEALEIDAKSATVNAGINVQPEAEALEIASYGANVNAEISISASSTALEITTFQANIGAVVEVSAASVALEAETHAANINAETSVSADSAALEISSHAATVKLNVSVPVSSAAYTLTTYGAELSHDINVHALCYEALITANDASVSYNPAEVPLAALEDRIKLYRDYEFKLSRDYEFKLYRDYRMKP